MHGRAVGGQQAPGAAEMLQAEKDTPLAERSVLLAHHLGRSSDHQGAVRALLRAHFVELDPVGRATTTNLPVHHPHGLALRIRRS